MIHAPLATFSPVPVPEAAQQMVQVFGSTGSIGRSALEVIRRAKGRFAVHTLTARSQIALLAEQIEEFHPKIAVVGSAAGKKALQDFLSSSPDREITILVGEAGLVEAASAEDAEIHVAGLSGMAGLPSVLAAIRAGHRVALANKESIVAAGGLIATALEAHPTASLIPVDSEHSAIFQCLVGSTLSNLSQIVLTASGGPFFGWSRAALVEVTPEQALAHPTWDMGPKNSIDSATCMNKALEIIEACWLFGVSESTIEVVVHPQSIVHSLVSFIDGSVLAQLSAPDMCGALGYALSYPSARIDGLCRQLDLVSVGKLEFFSQDEATFPAIVLGREAYRAGPGACLVFNVANEIAVEAFLRGKLPFLGISAFVLQSLEHHSDLTFSSEEELLLMEAELRRILSEGL